MRALALVVALAACSFPRPPDVAPGDGGDGGGGGGDGSDGDVVMEALGTLDTDFGVSGVRVFSQGTYFEDIVVKSDGSVYAGGRNFGGCYVVHISADGAADSHAKDEILRMSTIGTLAVQYWVGNKGWIKFAFYSPWDLELLCKKLGLLNSSGEPNG